ncbi:MAG TPA: OmpA family protein [Xanthobacteraceae bacterium]|nr:OmpA family protein [Xanthobacteraceae bacterium]
MLLAAACAENKTEPIAQQPPVPSVPLGTTQDFFLNVGDRVFFAENSAELTPTSLATLDKQAEWLGRYTNYRVTIEGHSDEKGPKEKNMKLSRQRGDAVRGYLASKGVEPMRVRVVAYGRERRVATCNDMSCWSQNRRVVTVLDTGPSEPVVATRARPGVVPPPTMPTYAPPPPPRG